MNNPIPPNIYGTKLFSSLQLSNYLNINGKLNVGESIIANSLSDGTAVLSEGRLSSLLHPIIDSDAATKQYVDLSALPIGGTTNQVLTKASDSNYDTTWSVQASLPIGGTTNQVLTKASDSNYDTTWSVQTPLSFEKYIYVQTKDDFGTDIDGIITLVANTAYFITKTVDLGGARIVCSGTTAILGSSSETALLKSTGLTGQPLIYSKYTLPIQNLSITADIAINIQGLGNNVALDWNALNFVDCPNIGTISNTNNFIYTNSAFLGSSNMIFTGTISTIGFSNCLFVSKFASSPIFDLTDSSLVISRRIRWLYSSFVVLSNATGVLTNGSISVPAESFIMNTVNFSGTGTFISTLDVQNSNSTLITDCNGISNTAVNGQMYMTSNVTQTIITNTNNFFKIEGDTLASSDNAKYLSSNNRLTNDAVIERKFLIIATLTYVAGNNNICEFGIYDSVIAGIREPSRTKTTANGVGRAENVTLVCVIRQNQGDYVEIHARNTSSTTNITVESINVCITET
jgi:hypothetical protein